MRILYIYNLYQQYGGENMWFKSEPELFQAHGHHVLIYARDNNEIKNFPLWKKVSLFWEISWSKETYQQVRNLIKRDMPEIAHIYNTVALVSPSVYYACKDEGIPIVQTLYNYRLLCPASTFLRDGHICEQCVQHSLWRSVYYGCYRHSRIQTAALSWMLQSHRWRGTWNECIDAYLVPTEFMRRKFIEGGLPAEKIFVKPNWHHPDPGVRDNNCCEGYALFVGRLSPEKGIRTLLKAWECLKSPPMLKIVGDGPLKEEIRASVQNHPSKKLEFLGYMPHDELINCLKRASFLIIPSEWYEGFPHVILEAYACGVPIIASNIGTLADVIEDGKTGLLFEPKNPKDLALKVEWMVQNKDYVYQMSLSARKEYLGKYTADKNYQLLLEIYQKLISSKL